MTSKDTPRPDRLDAVLARAFGTARSTDDLALQILKRDAGDWTRLLLREPAPDASAIVRSPAGDSDDLTPEGTLPARYRVDGEIAHGGVGVVLRARDTTLARDVAIKVLRTRHLDTPRMVDRFLEEAQIGAQLQHPGIVPVHDAGLLGDRRPFFTMKLVHGRTLAALLGERSTPAERQAHFLSVFERVCQTVAYAHARGVIHRDLKPSNVMVGAFGEVQVTDWGMAKVLAEGGNADEARRPIVEDEQVATVRSTSDSSASIAGSVFGTPGYMAPEQARGEVERLSERTDVFALGAVLCEILTGGPPFRGDRDEALARARAGDTEAARAALAKSPADPEVVALACACLAPQPADRPVSAKVVADALAGHVAAVAERARAAELATAQAIVRAAAERRTRVLSTALLSVLLIAVLGAGGVWWWLREAQHRRAERTATAVDAALADGRGLWQRAAASGQVAAWETVDATARRALALTGSDEADAATAARARSFADAAATELDAARTRDAIAAADHALRSRLDAILGMPALDFDWQRQDQAFVALFGELGFDPKSSAPGAAESLRGHRLVGELAAGLDGWVACRHNLSQDPGTWRPISALADAIDPDALRVHLRGLIASPQLESSRQLAAGLDLAQTPPRTIGLLGRALETAGDKDAALRVLRRGIACHPDDFCLAMGLAQQTLNEPAESLRYASAAFAVQPGSLHAGVWLSAILGELRRHEEAITLLQRLLPLHPDSDKLHHNLGSSLYALRQYAAALPHLERASAIDPTDHHTLHTLGRVQRALQRNDAARRSFERAVELAPDCAPALVALGMSVSDDLQDHETARTLFARAAAADPRAADARFFVGFMLEKLGRPAEALVAWRACVAIDPRYLPAWERIARVEDAADHPAEVQVACERALAVDPSCPWALSFLASARAAQIEQIRK